MRHILEEPDQRITAFCIDDTYGQLCDLNFVHGQLLGDRGFGIVITDRVDPDGQDHRLENKLVFQ